MVNRVLTVAAGVGLCADKKDISPPLAAIAQTRLCHGKRNLNLHKGDCVAVKALRWHVGVNS